ncbi:MAG: peptide deformylase [Omnitrophica bacterium RIFCSPHIGHO2_02_FULL_46_11]|nr:MAG: peptide deformylase [Omnitrophica bacterium RIFCSPHIGHO2_02_FULL_46_11]OGW86333.1 MAG: peptide deformylase [Omnitrophica bacterium RIFCSPLOWO2_01_FULL_45_10b]
MPSRLAIRHFPDSILRRVSEPVRTVDRQTRIFIDQLIKFMKCQPGGIGIAAPQVGVPRQIAIVDASAKVPGAKLLVLINPVITTFEHEAIFREGCMSLPDFTANVRRAEKIKFEWRDIHFKKQEHITSGLEARCVQHEIDHLNGFLFVDRVVSLKTDVFRRKRYL